MSWPLQKADVAACSWGRVFDLEQHAQLCDESGDAHVRFGDMDVIAADAGGDSG